MTIKDWMLISTCAALLSMPAGAQTDSAASPGKKDHQFSAAMQKKVAQRLAALRADSAAPVGPLFDRLQKSWTIEAADCSLVKSQLKGTGLKKHTVWITVNDDASFHAEIRTEASGTASEASGNQYIWIYNEIADLDTLDPNVDQPVVTGSSTGTFQLIPLTSDGTGYLAAQYLKADTPTPLNGIVAPVASSAPLGCQPL
jgi:hypothetical protein